MTSLGNRVYGLAAICLGLVGIAWHDFATTWQPVPDDLPGRLVLAYVAAGVLIAAGTALQWRRTAWLGSLALAALYAIFALLWARRVAGFPQIFGTWLGFAEQLALVIGGVLAYALTRPRADRTAIRLALGGRIAFGLCLLVFGAAHLIYPVETAAMVPGWLPPGPRFWALATGGFHLLAGLAVLSGVRALLAARLAVAMFAGFGLLVWAPMIVLRAGDQVAWGGNAVNLALVGAAWVLADSIAAIRSVPGKLWPLKG